MKYTFSVISQVTAVADMKTGRSRIGETKVFLECSKGNAKAWKDKHGVVNERGLKVQTQGLIYGLVANIHFGHQLGTWDSAEHLRYIIKELERGFAFANAKADVSTMD